MSVKADCLFFVLYGSIGDDEDYRKQADNSSENQERINFADIHYAPSFSSSSF